MRLALFLLVAACAAVHRAPGGRSPDDAVRRFTEAVEASDFDAAARMMAPGYREEWLVCSVAVFMWFVDAVPEMREAFDRIRDEHGFRLREGTFREPMERSHLEAIRRSVDATGNPEALLAIMLRAYLTMLGRFSGMTGYPEDVGRAPDWPKMLEDTRTVEVDGRWFVVLDRPTVKETRSPAR